jgi:general secretion pathway protein D
VLSDGYTINLALIPSDTEFGGYDQLNLPQVAGTLNVVELPTVLPKFTVRQLVTTVNVWDGQTVVLGGLITSSVQSTKDSVPVVGDIPLLGRLFQSESKVTKKDNLMIFVTSTIVDPAGNRVHSDDELPFAQSSVPVQSSDNIAPTESVKTVGMSGLEK